MDDLKKRLLLVRNYSGTVRIKIGEAIVSATVIDYWERDEQHFAELKLTFLPSDLIMAQDFLVQQFVALGAIADAEIGLNCGKQESIWHLFRSYPLVQSQGIGIQWQVTLKFKRYD